MFKFPAKRTRFTQIYHHVSVYIPPPKGAKSPMLRAIFRIIEASDSDAKRTGSDAKLHAGGNGTLCLVGDGRRRWPGADIAC